MVEYAHRRHWVERFHEEAKELLGWDQYQGRLWTGFHRNSVLVMLAYSFLVRQEFEHRQEVSRARPAAAAFFPLGPTAGDCPCRKCIVASSIGCGVRPSVNRFVRDFTARDLIAQFRPLHT